MSVVYVVKEGFSGDGYSIRGIFTDREIAKTVAEELILGSSWKFYRPGVEYYWVGRNSTAYICVSEYPLNEKV